MMGYPALEHMREKNQRKYGINGPAIPQESGVELLKNGELERAVLHFVRHTCAGLGYAADERHQQLEDADGRSAAEGQIPLNMEKDLNRLCLERAIHRFMQTGTASDAFDIYFCYLEMFLGGYGNSRKMIEMLAEFESNGSALLMRHRDHYSHSVYVFLLGLAIYEEMPLFRGAYQRFYGLADDAGAAHHFLQYWGLTALFHDIGYPFELPFEQVKSYFNNSIKNVPFVAYQGVSSYTIPEPLLRRFLTEKQQAALSSRRLSPAAVLAENLTGKLYPAYHDFANYREYLSRTGGEDTPQSYRAYLEEDVLLMKPQHPERFNGYMDHAFFSALILMRKLADVLPAQVNPTYADALTAILLHNSMYKFSVTNVKDAAFNSLHPFRMETHPLAYILMLCDELQCWDRVAYGQNSRQEYHPFGCDFIFEGNSVRAVYRYDRELGQRRENTGTYKKMMPDTADGGAPVSCAFLRDIEDIVFLNSEDTLALRVEREKGEVNRTTHQYLSNSNFVHLYNFAVALNAQYDARDYTTGNFVDLADEEMEASFERLSLEYKLSNIAQAKAFGMYLNQLGCFYTDRAVDYPLKRQFTLQELNTLGMLEHDRWNEEKAAMGWQYGTEFAQKPNGSTDDKKCIRERTRTHNDLFVPYHALDDTEKMKDTAPMNHMMKLIEKFDGLRIYRLTDNN